MDFSRGPIVHLPHRFAPDQIYAKTETGLRELVHPRLGLDSRQRRVLTELDGVRSLEMLTDFCLDPELENILSLLMNRDFIFFISESAAGQPASDSFSCAMADLSKSYVSDAANLVKGRRRSGVLTEDPAQFAAAKELMLEATVVHLGILGRDLMHKIGQAASAYDLLMLAGRWNVALCESKTANRCAPLYLEKLKLFLLEDGLPVNAIRRAGNGYGLENQP